MRIVLIPDSYPPQIGGVAIAVSNLAQQLAKKGHIVVVIANSPTLGFSYHVDPCDVRVFRIPFPLPRIVTRAGLEGMARSTLRSLASPILMPASLLRLMNLLKLLRPDIINLHYIGENAFYCLAARTLIDSKLVVNIHGDDIQWYRRRSVLPRFLTAATLRSADRVLSNSRALLEEAQQICPSIRGRSAVVGNGISLEEFRASKPYTHPRRYLLAVGNFFPKKGFDILIRAFHLVHRTHPDIDLLLAGDGPERQKCFELTRQLGLENYVVFLGEIKHSEVPALLKGCEAFVLPSREEPFGIVILEAMASGKAVVAHRVGGVPEIVVHLENGILVQPGQPEELAKAIGLLFEDDKLARKLGQRGFEWVRGKFTWDRIADNFISQYLLAMQSSAEVVA